MNPILSNELNLFAQELRECLSPAVLQQAAQGRDQWQEPGDHGGEREDEDDERYGHADGLGPLHVGVLHLRQVVGRLRVAGHVGRDSRRAHGLPDHVLQLGRAVGPLPVVAVQPQRGVSRRLVLGDLALRPDVEGADDRDGPRLLLDGLDDAVDRVGVLLVGDLQLVRVEHDDVLLGAGGREVRLDDVRDLGRIRPGDAVVGRGQVPGEVRGGEHRQHEQHDPGAQHPPTVARHPGAPPRRERRARAMAPPPVRVRNSAAGSSRRGCDALGHRSPPLLGSPAGGRTDGSSGGLRRSRLGRSCGPSHS